MSTATQEILFGITGQALVLEVDRPLTSVTSVSVWDLASDDVSTAEAATTGSASIDSATEATTAAAGDGQTDPTKMSVASTTGFVSGRRYLISKGGRSETFELEWVDTDTALYARLPLINAYASGATVDATIRASIAVDSTWASDVSELSQTANPNPGYRVRWAVVHADDSTTGVYLRNFDLVRYPSAPPVSPLDVDAAHPGWIDGLPTDYRDAQGRPLIVEATRAVRLDLYARGIADQSLRNAEAYAGLVIERAVLASIEENAKRGSATAATAYPIAKDAYERRLAGLVDSPRLALDRSGGGAVTTVQGRGERLTRR